MTEAQLERAVELSGLMKQIQRGIEKGRFNFGDLPIVQAEFTGHEMIGRFTRWLESELARLKEEAESL